MKTLHTLYLPENSLHIDLAAIKSSVKSINPLTSNKGGHLKWSQSAEMGHRITNRRPEEEGTSRIYGKGNLKISIPGIARAVPVALRLRYTY